MEEKKTQKRVCSGSSTRARVQALCTLVETTRSNDSGRLVAQQAVFDHARAVDDPIQPAKLGPHRVDQPRQRGGVAHVQGVVFELAARLADRLQVGQDLAILLEPLVGDLDLGRAGGGGPSRCSRAISAALISAWPVSPAVSAGSGSGRLDRPTSTKRGANRWANANATFAVTPRAPPVMRMTESDESGTVGGWVRSSGPGSHWKMTRRVPSLPTSSGPSTSRNSRSSRSASSSGRCRGVQVHHAH
jgi:hypothetical protein